MNLNSIIMLGNILIDELIRQRRVLKFKIIIKQSTMHK